ncbi:MAG: flavin reductase [Desulfobacteraceae bacterium]|nr:flavin reductase [Desulfobacteraceae bacterium]
MFALGLQGSPRKDGNSDILLSLFMKELERHGFQTQIVQVAQKDIQFCKEFTVCEKKGICPIQDDMSREIYTLLREADVVVAASPVFFYNVSAQLKALIDRCQTLWARRYMLKLHDPASSFRRGFLLAVGATAGKQLFEGMHLTAKYFFDALGADYTGSLTYRRVEGKGKIKSHPTVQQDVSREAAALAKGLSGRRKVLFASCENACRSQMAAAFAQKYGGHKFDVIQAGSYPAGRIDPLMVDVMAEKGIDMGFRRPRSLQDTVGPIPIDVIISFGDGETDFDLPGADCLEWQLPAASGRNMEQMRSLCAEIEKRVIDFVNSESNVDNSH